MYQNSARPSTDGTGRRGHGTGLEAGLAWAGQAAGDVSISQAVWTVGRSIISGRSAGRSLIAITDTDDSEKRHKTDMVVNSPSQLSIRMGH